MHNSHLQHADLGKLWWAWEDLNFRPLPYQGRPLGPRPAPS